MSKPYFGQVDGSYLLGWGVSTIFLISMTILRYHVDHSTMWSERGIVENFQLFLLLISLALVVYLGLSGYVHDRLGQWVVGLTGLGLIFLTGEEISWGQHFFGWNPDPWFHRMNHQHETNLHNVYPIFNNWPRNFLQIFIAFCCFVWPFVKNKKLGILEKFRIFIPDASCFVLGFYVVLIKIIREIRIEPFGLRRNFLAEMVEVIFYIFILNMVLIWFRRYKSQNKKVIKQNR